MSTYLDYTDTTVVGWFISVFLMYNLLAYSSSCPALYCCCCSTIGTDNATNLLAKPLYTGILSVAVNMRPGSPPDTARGALRFHTYIYTCRNVGLLTASQRAHTLNTQGSRRTMWCCCRVHLSFTYLHTTFLIVLQVPLYILLNSKNTRASYPLKKKKMSWTQQINTPFSVLHAHEQSCFGAPAGRALRVH